MEAAVEIPTDAITPPPHTAKPDEKEKEIKTPELTKTRKELFPEEGSSAGSEGDATSVGPKTKKAKMEWNVTRYQVNMYLM